MTSISWGLYLILAAINVLAFFFVRYCLGKSKTTASIARVRFRQITDHVHAAVETRGKTLEEMASLFGIEENHSGQHDSREPERRQLLRDDPGDDDMEDEA